MRRSPSTAAEYRRRPLLNPAKSEEVEGTPVSLIRITLRRTGTRGTTAARRPGRRLRVRSAASNARRCRDCICSRPACRAPRPWCAVRTGWPLSFSLCRSVDSLRSELYGVRTMVRDQAKSSDTIGGLAKRRRGRGRDRPLLPAARAARRAGAAARRDPPLWRPRTSGASASSARRRRPVSRSEIKELLDLNSSDDRARARELANARVAAIDAKIAELGEARDALAGLATACARKRGGACPILSAFER